MYAKVEIEYPSLVEKYRLRGMQYRKYEAKARGVFRDLATGRFIAKVEFELHQGDVIEPEVVPSGLWVDEYNPLSDLSPWTEEDQNWVEFHTAWLEAKEVSEDPDYHDTVSVLGYLDADLNGYYEPVEDRYRGMEVVSLGLKGKRRDVVEKPDPSKWWVPTHLNPRISLNNRSQQWLLVAQSIGWVRRIE